MSFSSEKITTLPYQGKDPTDEFVGKKIQRDGLDDEIKVWVSK